MCIYFAMCIISIYWIERNIEKYPENGKKKKKREKEKKRKNSKPKSRQ